MCRSVLRDDDHRGGRGADRIRRRPSTEEDDPSSVTTTPATVVAVVAVDAARDAAIDPRAADPPGRSPPDSQWRPWRCPTEPPPTSAIAAVPRCAGFRTEDTGKANGGVVIIERTIPPKKTLLAPPLSIRRGRGDPPVVPPEMAAEAVVRWWMPTLPRRSLRRRRRAVVDGRTMRWRCPGAAIPLPPRRRAPSTAPRRRRLSGGSRSDGAVATRRGKEERRLCVAPCHRHLTAGRLRQTKGRLSVSIGMMIYERTILVGKFRMRRPMITTARRHQRRG